MHSLAAANPYTWTFDTTVETVDGATVVLAETYFYPEGGGQPADRGAIADVPVTDVQYRNGRIVHELAETPTLEAGDAVTAAVDPTFRTTCMRAHTASHLLYGAGRRLLADLGYGGFDISASVSRDGTETRTRATDDDESSPIDIKVRVDFSTSSPITDETLVAFERLTNMAVWDSRPVSWEELPQEEALEREDIAFNTKTEEGLGDDTVRVVTIDGWDVAACGGTHVKNTREIGPVTVLERSNPGEGLTRVEFTVGPNAIDRRALERERATTAAATLGTRLEDLPDAVERLQTERDELEAELETLREEVVTARLEALREEARDKSGVKWLVGSLSGLDANGLAEQAQETVGEEIGVAALVSEDGQYLAVATTGDVDASEVVDAVTTEFGGGGGGGPTVAQGGGLGADADAIVEWLRDW